MGQGLVHLPVGISHFRVLAWRRSNQTNRVCSLESRAQNQQPVSLRACRPSHAFFLPCKNARREGKHDLDSHKESLDGLSSACCVGRGRTRKSVPLRKKYLISVPHLSYLFGRPPSDLLLLKTDRFPPASGLAPLAFSVAVVPHNRRGLSFSWLWRRRRAPSTVEGRASEQKLTAGLPNLIHIWRFVGCTTFSAYS